MVPEIELPRKASVEVAEPSGATPLSYNKACNLEDFADADLRSVIRTVFAHEIGRFGPDFPNGREYRKHWEVAMAVRAIRDAGHLHGGAEVLGVGAGNEPTLFWLTTKVMRVFATDLYLGGTPQTFRQRAAGWARLRQRVGDLQRIRPEWLRYWWRKTFSDTNVLRALLSQGKWTESANRSMLIDPNGHWPAAWNPRRLVVQHMDALDLRYEDESFDAIFSSSSIEHFGSLDDVQRAAKEMFRVLRPGGVLSLSTEFRLAGSPPGLPGILMFDAKQVEERIIGDLAWSPISPLDLTMSVATRRAAQRFEDAAVDIRKHVGQHHGCLLFHKLEWSSYPHIVLRLGDLAWTSVHLALRKWPR